MDAIFGMAGDDFVIVCADKTHCRSIVKMDVRASRRFVLSPGEGGEEGGREGIETIGKKNEGWARGAAGDAPGGCSLR